MDRLSRMLDIPVVPMVARTGEGLKKAMELAVGLARAGKRDPLRLSYGADLDTALLELEKGIESSGLLAARPVRATEKGLLVELMSDFSH